MFFIDRSAAIKAIAPVNIVAMEDRTASAVISDGMGSVDIHNIVISVAITPANITRTNSILASNTKNPTELVHPNRAGL
ncbi:hypothetical protein TOL_1291 [Thalassolituus oleivorans MIL-1]|uniref:Uncharacterized protein n=1 Tax=Thalassolituus oleivorans MIL-1 TaxID=1298593 RepID=M5E2B0_9GAMM|nr:hypothetical protein TOL_1291 [Thalassolituus oleivorans MIL-1]